MRLWFILGLLALVSAVAAYGAMRAFGPELFDVAAKPRNGDRSRIPLMTVPAAQVKSVEIILEDRLHRFERTTDGGWYFHAHGETGGATGHSHAGDPQVAFEIERSLKSFAQSTVAEIVALADQSAAYGVAHSGALIMLFSDANDRPFLKLAGGSMTADRAQQYAMVEGAQIIVALPVSVFADLADLVYTLTQTSPAN